ncbi:AAA family ATPase [Pseudomonas benzopyrenica]|uniref:AAA family ATPase n=1 Tax=Pseudomonas benzopyrenica TaxID=2993566 RepID=UPI0039C25B48
MRSDIQLTFSISSDFKAGSRNHVNLSPKSWDDYSFKTEFLLTYFDEYGAEHSVGSVKIGKFGQRPSSTRDLLQDTFLSLDKSFFSLGQSPEYYQRIAELGNSTSKKILSALRDVVLDEEILDAAFEETVFENSLIRYTSLSSIRNQYRRLLWGGQKLVSYEFSFKRPPSKKFSEISLDFAVNPKSLPPSNMHILIGRNGVGKTTVLNQMVKALIQEKDRNRSAGMFYVRAGDSQEQIDPNYFSCVMSVSFSAFDPFRPLTEIAQQENVIRNHYIGLKSLEGDALKTQGDLENEFFESLLECFNQPEKQKAWTRAVTTLNSDLNFKEMELLELAKDFENERFYPDMVKKQRRMSSGHAIVILIITRMIAYIEEKTLILLDEPESHLHPPLLSAFTRALSTLLTENNGVAIVATHSPVVLQEVPKSCVSKLYRSGLQSKCDRPSIETFGENVGTLTSEVFGLEVAESGFMKLLKKSVNEGLTYEEIIRQYKGQIGFEGRAILKSLISTRDSRGFKG